jgi:RNA polymerase sigma factor (sigma-70 family)
MNVFMTAKVTESLDDSGSLIDASALVVGHAVRAGDHSVEAVFRQEWKPLLRLATLLVGNPQTGEEIAQEAFTRWYVHRSSVDNSGAYLRTAVVNLAKGHHRRTKVFSRKVHYLRTDAMQQVESPHDVMLDMVDGLPSRQRAAIVLRYYEGMSELDIAEIIGCRPGTVKSLLSRALATLRLGIER